MPATPASRVHDLGAHFETVLESVLTAEAQSPAACHYLCPHFYQQGRGVIG